MNDKQPEAAQMCATVEDAESEPLFTACEVIVLALVVLAGLGLCAAAWVGVLP